MRREANVENAKFEVLIKFNLWKHRGENFTKQNHIHEDYVHRAFTNDTDAH